MTDSSLVREGEKLKGSVNYYNWSLKLRAEGLWTITETQHNPDAYLVTSDEEQISAISLQKKKFLACHFLLTSIAEHLIPTVARHTDPALAWNALKKRFFAGDNSQILSLLNDLHSMKMAKGSLVEEFINRATDLRD